MVEWMGDHHTTGGTSEHQPPLQIRVSRLFPVHVHDLGARDLKEQYQWQARTQFHCDPLRGCLAIEVAIYFPTKRRTD